MNILRQSYRCCIRFLANHSGLAILLSHGGLHLIVLLCLIVLSLVLYNQTKQFDRIDLSTVKIQFADDNHAYVVRSIDGDIFMNDARINLDGSLMSEGATDLLFFLVKDDISTSSIKMKDIDSTETTYDVTISINEDRTSLEMYDFKRAHIDETEMLLETNNYLNYLFTCKGAESLLLPVSFCGEDIYRNKKNKSPTTAVFLSFFMPIWDSEPDSLYYNGYLTIHFGNEYSSDGEVRPYEVKYVFPEPDIITPFKISFRSQKALKSVIENHGIYFIIEDVIAKNEASRKSLQFTVLIGAIIAFMLDIIVNLILKWRKLRKTQGLLPNRRTNINKRKKRV